MQILKPLPLPLPLPEERCFTVWYFVLTFSLLFAVGRDGTKSSPNTVSIVVGILVPLLILFIVAYFVWRYRRDGSSPSDIVLDMKRKAAMRFRRENPPVILRYDTDHVCHDDDGFDTSDTNPFVRD